jgi:hypothetical protein
MFIRDERKHLKQKKKFSKHESPAQSRNHSSRFHLRSSVRHLTFAEHNLSTFLFAGLYNREKKEYIYTGRRKKEQKATSTVARKKKKS